MSVNFVAKTGGVQLVKILEFIEGHRKMKGLTRAELADKMNDIVGYDAYSKDKLDDIFGEESCPRAETLALMMEALDMPTYPYAWYRAKKGRREEE